MKAEVMEAPEDMQDLHYLEFRAMGSHIVASIKSEDPEALLLLNQVPLWFEEWEQTLSRFRPDSELSLLNHRGPGAWPLQVSPVLWEVLHLALESARSTGGLVTPTVLDALEVAGYRESFDLLRPGTSDGMSEECTGRATVKTRACASWRDIKSYPHTRSVRLPRDVRLDLGGIAKGWAADQAVTRLSQHGPAMVNAGGDIAIGGPTDQSLTWTVAVEAPVAPTLKIDDPVDVLSIVSGGVATSGQDYRRWLRNGHWQHHIIDPRTGSPSITDVLSVTVVAPTACEGEVAAKAVFLLGSEKGLEWLENRASLAGLLVLENGVVVRSKGLINYY